MRPLKNEEINGEKENIALAEIYQGILQLQKSCNLVLILCFLQMKIENKGKEISDKRINYTEYFNFDFQADISH